MRWEWRSGESDGRRGREGLLELELEERRKKRDRDHSRLSPIPRSGPNVALSMARAGSLLRRFSGTPIENRRVLFETKIAKGNE